MREHKHLIVRAIVDAPPKKKNDVRNWLVDTIDAIDMKIMAGPFFEYATAPINKGWTGIAIIEFSHVALHIWENEGLIELDVFSCKQFDIDKVMQRVKTLEPRVMSIQYIDRDAAFGAPVKFWTFYKTTNVKNGKVYYGVHGAPFIDRRYLGSGRAMRQAIKKHGRDSFKVEHLKFFFSEAEAYAYEAKFLTPSLLKDRNTYNVGRGGNGGHKTVKDLVWVTDGASNKMIERHIAVRDYIGAGWEYGRTISTATREKMRGRESPFKGVKRGPNGKKGVKFTDQHRAAIKRAHWANNGKKVSPETRAKQSAALRGRPKAPTTLGRRLVNNGERQMLITGPCPEGWLYGRLKRHSD